jgi:GTPase SAR1 family protein
MLPSEPKIFHGRESELSDILQLFSEGNPRITILGAGGIGKTSLARAVVHHQEMIDRYEQHRFFIACDSAGTKVELTALIGAQLGLKPGEDLTQPVVHHFSSSRPSLLILDNLETAWEPAKSRGDIEGFLCLLAQVDDLALIVSAEVFLCILTQSTVDHNARSRKASQSTVDSSISTTPATLGSAIRSSNIHRYCRGHAQPR